MSPKTVFFYLKCGGFSMCFYIRKNATKNDRTFRLNKKANPQDSPFAILEYYFSSGKSIFRTFCVTRRDCPAYGKMCIIIIGLKLASITPQDCRLGSAGLVKSGMIKSTPHTAAPMALVIPTAKAL